MLKSLGPHCTVHRPNVTNFHYKLRYTYPGCRPPLPLSPNKCSTLSLQCCHTLSFFLVGHGTTENARERGGRGGEEGEVMTYSLNSLPVPKVQNEDTKHPAKSHFLALSYKFRQTNIIKFQFIFFKSVFHVVSRSAERPVEFGLCGVSSKGSRPAGWAAITLDQGDLPAGRGAGTENIMK